MSRYLTPAKVTLLALAHVYVDGFIPVSESAHVLLFLTRNILLDLTTKSSTDTDVVDVALPISQFETLLSKKASNAPDHSIWDVLLLKLWTIDCSAALDKFIEALPDLFVKPRDQLLYERISGEESDQPSGKILPTSPLGAFIRRCHLEYTRLQFEDGVAIWQALIMYRNQTRPVLEKKNNTSDRNMLDVNLSDLSIDGSHPVARTMFKRLEQLEEQEQGAYSTYDVEKLLDFQASEMQRLGGRMPDDMHTKLKQMSRKGVALPKMAYYLRFLDSWRAGDHSSAFDNLHRYFDYTMLSRDRTFYQYALLNLAILQADFGCHAEAVSAMQEAIGTARENRDTVCLNFCMSWLYHFGRAFPTQMNDLRENAILGAEVEGLDFLKSRARDAEMWVLLSNSLFCEAKIGLNHGESLALVFENIVKASYISIVKTDQNVTGPALLIKGSVFGRIGQNHMAEICADAFLECYTKEAPLEDVLKCICRQANMLVQQGRYTEAEAVMADVPEKILKVLKLQNFWSYYSSLLKLRRFLYRDDLDAASQIVQQLRGQGPPDTEMDFTLGFLEIGLHTRRGDLEDALRVVEELADRVQIENDDITIRVKLMVLKVGLWEKSGHAMKGFSLVMRAVNLAYGARLLPVLWEALCALTRIFHELQEFKASKDLLEAVMPQILECQDCELTAGTHSLLADANMGLAGREEARPTRRKDYMSRAMRHIEAAFEQFKHVEDLKGQLEMLAKKGQIQYFRGDLALANDTAGQYLRIRNEYVASRK